MDAILSYFAQTRTPRNSLACCSDLLKCNVSYALNPDEGLRQFVEEVRQDFLLNKQDYLTEIQSLVPEIQVVDIRLIGSYGKGGHPTPDSDVDLEVLYTTTQTTPEEVADRLYGKIYGYGGVFDIVPKEIEKLMDGPYRYNPDEAFRRLERSLQQSSDWEEKLRYNIAALRSGVIPPPDIEVSATWKRTDLDEYRRYRVGALWFPTEEMRQKWYRKWFFPNGVGLAASYNMDDPIPGLAPIPTRVPLDEHLLEVIGFTWKALPRYGPEHFYSRIMDKATVHAWPAEGAPDVVFDGRITPRFEVNDENTLLRALQLVATGGPDALENI